MRPWRPLFVPGFVAVLAAAPGLSAQEKGQEFSLPNGLRVCLLERHDNPVVRLHLELRWTVRDGMPGKEGAPALLAQLLEVCGAGHLSRKEFDHSLAENGLCLSFQDYRDAFSWDLATDSHDQETAFGHLADAVFRPVLEGPLLEARRNALGARLRALSPRDRALATFQDRIGSLEAILPGQATLNSMELQDLVALHRRIARPERALLVLHGDLNLAQARQLALLHFGVWGASEPSNAPEQDPIKSQDAPRLFSLEAPTTEARVGTMDPCPRPAQELLALLVPRLLKDSGLQVRLERRGPLVLETQKGATEVVLQSALDRLRKGFSQEELDRAKLLWRAQRAALPLHPSAWTERVADEILGDQRNLETRIQALGLQDCNGALRDWIAPGNLCWLRIGPGAAQGK